MKKISHTHIIIIIFAGIILLPLVQMLFPFFPIPVINENRDKVPMPGMNYTDIADGKFMGGPSLLTDKTRAMSSEDLRNLIINGKPNTNGRKMPSFAGMMTPEALDTLVAEIKAAKRSQADKESGQETHGREGPAN